MVCLGFAVTPVVLSLDCTHCKQARSVAATLSSCVRQYCTEDSCCLVCDAVYLVHV